MDAAEDLIGPGDAIRRPRADAVEDRAAGAVNAGQAKDADIAAQRSPRRVGGVAVGTAAGDRGARVDPGAAGIPIDDGRGKIADPARRGEGERLAIASENRGGDGGWRRQSDRAAWRRRVREWG